MLRLKLEKSQFHERSLDSVTPSIFTLSEKAIVVFFIKIVLVILKFYKL